MPFAPRVLLARANRFFLYSTEHFKASFIYTIDLNKMFTVLTFETPAISQAVLSIQKSQKVPFYAYLKKN
jgi:hypothetical protein